MASLTVAIIGVANLASLYLEVQFWLKLRAVRDYLSRDQGWDKFTLKKLPSVVWELKRLAEEDFLVERSKHDMKLIEKRCRDLALQHNKKQREKAVIRNNQERRIKMKTFRTNLKRINSRLEDRSDNQSLINKIEASRQSGTI